MYVTKYFVINVKCAKRYKTSEQNFPGSFFEWPALFNAHQQDIKNEKQKQTAVNRSD